MSGSRIVWQRPLYQPIYLHMEIKFDILFPLHHFTVAPYNVGQKTNAFCLEILALVNNSSPISFQSCKGRCAANKACVQCKVFRTGRLSLEQCSAECEDFKILVVSKVEPGEKKKRCTYVSLYLFSFFVF